MRRHNFDNITNSFWCIVTTMATSFQIKSVGYGDIYPITFFGRITVIISCLSGVFILSLFVITLTNVTKLTKGEETVSEIKKVFEQLEMEDNINNILKPLAANVIQCYWRNTRERSNMKLNFLNQLHIGIEIDKFRMKREFCE